MNWIHINDQKPEDGQNVFYFFDVFGVYKGKYQKSNYYVGHDDIESCWCDCFYGKKGFLTDDVTHWMPAPIDEEWDGVLPDVPEGYIFVTDGKFNEWVLEDETVIIKKDEYEHLKEMVKYYESGHKTGLVCPECTYLHIYHNDEDDGYKCGGCGKVYNTDNVEYNTYKYTSKYDRPCPNCNPIKRVEGIDYMNGFLEYITGVEPYSTEHYQCNKCDSTYCIEEKGKVSV